MPTVLMLSSDEHNDLHIRLSAKYAREGAQELRANGKDVSEIIHSNAIRFDKDLLEANDIHLIAFYLHGCRGKSSESCLDICIKRPCLDERTCVRGVSNLLLHVEDISVLRGKTVYGATTCYFGSIFAQKGAVVGVRAFLGYRGRFLHLHFDEEKKNPFADVINLGLVLLSQGFGTEEVMQEISKAYEYWRRQGWQQLETTKAGKRFARVCFINNQNELVAI